MIDRSNLDTISLNTLLLFWCAFFEIHLKCDLQKYCLSNHPWLLRILILAIPKGTLRFWLCATYSGMVTMVDTYILSPWIAFTISSLLTLILFAETIIRAFPIKSKQHWVGYFLPAWLQSIASTANQSMDTLVIPMLLGGEPSQESNFGWSDWWCGNTRPVASDLDDSRVPKWLHGSKLDKISFRMANFVRFSAGFER